MKKAIIILTLSSAFFFGLNIYFVLEVITAREKAKTHATNAEIFQGGYYNLCEKVAKNDAIEALARSYAKVMAKNRRLELPEEVRIYLTEGQTFAEKHFSQKK